MREYRLLNGLTIPAVGFGTWMIPDEKAPEAVKEALKVGYRLIDTAEAYENEEGVGKGIRESGLKREDVFLTTKLRAEFKDYDVARKAIEESLSKLDIGYIDLIIIHSPQPWKNYRDGKHYFEGNLQAWKALEEFYKAGKIKAIGVSNFEVIDLENLLNNGEVKPMVNQVLAHIGNMPFETIDFCKRNDIIVEAHSPFGHGEVLKDSFVREMATTYKTTPTQICLAYCHSHGMIPLAKSVSQEHMKENLNTAIQLKEEDLKKLDRYRFDNYGSSSIFPVYAKK